VTNGEHKSFGSKLDGPQRKSDGARDSKLVQVAVERAKQGDPEGIHFLYVRFAPDVRRYVASIVGSSHEAEDIAQNVFAKLVTAIERYERRETPFAAWILRVARNAALDHLRVKRALPAADIDELTGGSYQDWNERGMLLWSALRGLPADQREVLVLRHIVGLSPGEIARRLEKTESSIHGLHHRGRRALCASLTESGASPVVAASASG
jgi:RNA polymerase sigma-70 factor (ECF subfamily)